MTAVTLCAAYSATLVSSLAVRINAVPFKNFEDLLRTNEYEMSVVNNSAVLSEFEVSFRVFSIACYKIGMK
jgi:cellobiose-specific phosphotransferase system component IIC